MLVVRKSKRKGRLVPISPSAAERLDAYRLARNRIPGTRAEPFFRNEKGKRLSSSNAQYHFARVPRQIGIRERSLCASAAAGFACMIRAIRWP